MIKGLILAIVVISISITSVTTFEEAYAIEYKLYGDPDGIFSINYPEKWSIKKGIDSANGYVVQFQDTYERDSFDKNYLQVLFLEDIFYDQFTDSEVMKDMVEYEEDVCYSATYDVDKFICYNFSKISETKISSNPDIFQIEYTYIKEYEELEDSIKLHGITTDIVIGNDVWELKSETRLSSRSNSNIQSDISTLKIAMNSFDLLQTKYNNVIYTDLPSIEYRYAFENFLDDYEDSFFREVIQDHAIKKIQNANPWLSFRETSYDDAEIIISWIKDFGGGTMGQTHSSIGSVEIGIGDSSCGYYNYYATSTLGDIAAHELLHGIGFEHINDQKSIMYPYLSANYFTFHNLDLGEWVYQFIPICSDKRITDLDIYVEAVEQGEKFDVFYVKSSQDAERYANGENFNKYNNCYQENTTYFNKYCTGLSTSGGLVIGTEDIYDGINSITVSIFDSKPNELDFDLSKSPDIEYVLRENANYEKDLKNFSRAIAIYSKILEQNPNDTFALNHLGTVYHEMGNLSKALELYEKTLRLNPIDEYALNNIGTINMEQGNNEKALNYFERALKINPDNVNALKNERELKAIIDSSKGGGCLIATATFDSELAPQVQKLREIRDSKLLQTESGSQFMEAFNQFYYSFSPIIADYERENPVFKEIVKAGITPMLSTLSLMDYADTESEVLGIGISLIILNGIMYVGLPVFGIMIAKKKF